VSVVRSFIRLNRARPLTPGSGAPVRPIADTYSRSKLIGRYRLFTHPFYTPSMPASLNRRCRSRILARLPAGKVISSCNEAIFQ
jgi:hypothetical protein